MGRAYLNLIFPQDSKELANHLLNVSFIQIRGKNIIPYMENFHTTSQHKLTNTIECHSTLRTSHHVEGHYKCLSLVPHELCVYVDENELTSVDGIIRVRERGPSMCPRFIYSLTYIETQLSES